VEINKGDMHLNKIRKGHLKTSFKGAGVAAAVSYQSGIATSEIDVKLIQKELERQGVRIW